MESIIGFVGVILGAALTLIGEWWFQSRKAKKDAEYASILISYKLERYMFQCEKVVKDDGIGDDEDPNRVDELTRQVKEPTFDPLSLNVEWKSLPAKLVYDIFNFPHKAEIAEQAIYRAWDVSDPPHELEFEERQLQYATLGIEASELVHELRKHANLPERSPDDLKSINHMKRRKSDIESERMKKNARNSPL
ncbi:MAG: hypothetical protein LBU53_00875 [Zoogloeaceae bacterium]|jgi:hypothetical protein|nr:hypothetical protein [Zoogloeaceae bacterium]